MREKNKYVVEIFIGRPDISGQPTAKERKIKRSMSYFNNKVHYVMVKHNKLPQN